jgi:hypothetical protein
MKAYFIDSTKQEVTEIELEEGGYTELNMKIGCSTGTIPIIFSNEDSLWMDDEGLFIEDQTGFNFEFDEDDTRWKFVGNAILFGVNKDGNTIDVQTPITRLQAMITSWMSIAEVNLYKEQIGV